MAIVVGKTISKVVEDGLCTGCGTCVGMCPVDAIKMVIEYRKGIYIPQLDEEKCNQCGLCFEVCPGHGVDFKQLNSGIFGKEPEDLLLGNYVNCYVGHATDYDIRYNSASGGLVTALLIYALEQGMIDGALVTRMKKDKPLEPEPFIARTRDGIIEAAKSKYCPVPANIALKEILSAKEGNRFAVVGLPCHIHGIRKAETVNKKLAQRICMHLGILCSHGDSFWMTKFLLHKYAIREEDIAYLAYRGQGWPGYMAIQLKNGGEELIPFSDAMLFHNLGFFTPVRCILCCDQLNDFADISLGDAWLSEVMACDKTGTSVIISRNQIGKNSVEQAVARGEISLNSIDRDKIRRFGAKKADYRIKSSLAHSTGKKRPCYNLDLPNPGSLRQLLSLQELLNLSLSRRLLWKVIGPLAHLQQAGMRGAKRLGLRV